MANFNAQFVMLKWFYSLHSTLYTLHSALHHSFLSLSHETVMEFFPRSLLRYIDISALRSRPFRSWASSG